MFWRRKPRDEIEPGAGEPASRSRTQTKAPVTDAEIEAQLEAELAAADAATIEAAEAGTTAEPDPLGAPRAWEADAPAEPAGEPEPIVDGDLAAGRRPEPRRVRGPPAGDPRPRRRRTPPTWEEVEETLIAGDVGASLAIEVVERARARRDPGGPEAAVRAELAALLAPRETGWAFEPAAPGRPAVVLVVGVNGTGKTTTIGKIAARERAAGRSVLLAAGDTFRAAAIDQLRLWGERAGAPVVAHAPGADPGGGRLRRARRRDRPRRRRPHRGHRRPPAHEVEPHGRAGEDAPGHRPPPARAPARRSSSSSTPRPARTAWPRRGPSTRRPASPGSS